MIASPAMGVWQRNRSERRSFAQWVRRWLTGVKAIAGTNINSTTDAVSGLTITSDASISPAGNSLILVALSVGNLDANADPGVPTVIGNGITYDLIDRQIINVRRCVYLFRGMAAAPSSGTVVATWAVNVSGNMIIDQFTVVDCSGSNGAGAVVQSAKNSSAGATSLTVTLAAFANAANATYGTFSHQAAEATTPGSGFTELSEETAIPGLQTEMLLGNDTSVDASWTTSSAAGGVAIEIKSVGGILLPPLIHSILHPYMSINS